MNCDLICSGPSSNNVKLHTKTIIAANYSILNNSINNNHYVIWFLGPNYRYIDLNNPNEHHIFKDCLPILKIQPNELHIKLHPGASPQKLKFFKQLIKNKYPDIKFFDVPIGNGSMGCLALKYALKNFNKVYVCGMECNIGKYEYNTDFRHLYTDKSLYTHSRYKQITNNPSATHFASDKKILKQLIATDKERIIPINSSGLFTYINSH